jgi:hypothetical protein
MSEHKTICPKWLEKLEVEINEQLKQRFPKKDFSISNLRIEFNIIKPLDKFQSKRLVLTDQIIASYDSNFSLVSGEEKKAYNLVGEKLYERFKTRGIWQ